MNYTEQEKEMYEVLLKWSKVDSKAKEIVEYVKNKYKKTVSS